MDEDSEADEFEDEFEVVWNGGPLLPPRDQHPDPTWTAPKQQANKYRKYRADKLRPSSAEGGHEDNDGQDKD